MNGLDKWWLSKLASAGQAGWFFSKIDEHTRILVHAGDRCTRQDCPDRDTQHTHEPTDLHLAEMQSYVKRYEAI